MRKALVKRREQLRGQLKRHFSIPINQRDYAQFCDIVDELDMIRKQITRRYIILGVDITPIMEAI